MSVNYDQATDANERGYSLPVDCCVGDDSVQPTYVTTISKSGPSDKGLPARLTEQGGPTPSAAQFGSPKGAPRTYDSVPVGYDRDVTTDNNYVR